MDLMVIPINLDKTCIGVQFPEEKKRKREKKNLEAAKIVYLINSLFESPNDDYNKSNISVKKTRVFIARCTIEHVYCLTG